VKASPNHTGSIRLGLCCQFSQASIKFRTTTASLHQPGFACAEIVLLWLAIAAALAAFRPLSRAAAWLLAPYLAWVSFAAALNFALWRLNS